MGLLEITIESASPDDEPITTKAKNAETRTFLIEKWMLGPEKTKGKNDDYWREMATVWRIAPDQARRNLCANCEYFEDTPEMLKEMEVVPEDKFDKDGGGRGWCHKWEFICHNLRTCKAWEKADQNPDTDEGYGDDEQEADE